MSFDLVGYYRPAAGHSAKKKKKKGEGQWDGYGWRDGGQKSVQEEWQLLFVQGRRIGWKETNVESFPSSGTWREK